MRNTLEERFWVKVDRQSQDECWEWTAGKDRDGYGHIWENEGSRSASAHRVSWRIHFGEIPDGLYVCHHCDNPGCVNPDHLFLGTNQSNLADMDAKGRRAPQLGEKNPAAKLTEAQVRTILVSSETHQAMADRYGVTRECVFSVKQRKNWAWVTVEGQLGLVMKG